MSALDRKPWSKRVGPRGKVSIVDADGKPLCVFVGNGDAASVAILMAASLELLAALLIARDQIKVDRDVAFRSFATPGTGKIDDEDHAQIVAEYDDRLATIDAAIARASGGPA